LRTRLRMNYRVTLLGVLAALSLMGCHSLRSAGGTCNENKPYMKAASVAPLKIPPGLDMPDTASALHIPALNTPDLPPRKKTDACLDEAPEFKTPKQPPPQA
jgi:uncharacterized lipoprotein